jgi:hypothetical protein
LFGAVSAPKKEKVVTDKKGKAKKGEENIDDTENEGDGEDATDTQKTFHFMNHYSLAWENLLIK